MGLVRLSLPCWTSWRITVPVNVFVMLPIQKRLLVVTRSPGERLACPEAVTHDPCPGTLTAATIPGIWYCCSARETTV
jgi:hypothetical protein